MAALQCRQPWDGIGSEDNWKEFTKRDDIHGLYRVPCITEEERQSTFIHSSAIGRPMLFMQYPGSQPTNSSMLFSYWYFGAITSIDRMKNETRAALKIKSYKSLGGVMTIEKSVPLNACRDYARATTAFRNVSRIFLLFVPS